ncbi:unnamed protein product [Paramecium sonneborni]|uniref:Transmembrane protein n=1 Tax=Paramecium sonneborni TaxID=65129 RepID=A0A8S1LIE1_9CILI|nr:unnamed protein product [Paramecium sonneborni]
MKTKNNEFLSFNILNCPIPKQQIRIEDSKNLLISSRLNIPLLPLNSQQQKNDLNQLKLFRHLNEYTTIQDGFQQTQAFKYKSSIYNGRLLQNTIKQQIEIDQDFQSEEKIFTQKQLLKEKPLDSTLKNQNNNRNKISSMPTEPFEQGQQNFQNYESDLMRKRTIFSKQNIQINNTKKNQNQNNNNKLRSLTIHEISNKISQQQKMTNNPKNFLKVQKKKFRLKIVAIMVRAILKLSKKYKLLFQRRNQAIEHFQKLKEPHLNYFSSLGQREVQQKYKNFVQQLFTKITQLLQSKEYIKDYTDILKQQQELVVDFQKQRLCFFIKLLFQDLELITRKNIIPKFILHSLNLCLFAGKNTQTSQFVANRTKFYSKTVHSLTSQQKVLIALEYLIFTIIIPNLLEIANKQVYNNQDHFIIINIYLTAIAMLITEFFTNHFQNLAKIENSNVKPVQLILQIQEEEEEEEDKPIQTQLLVSKNLDKNERKVISGQIQLNFVNSIFEEKLLWKNQMINIFSRIVNNIEDLIDIQNAE